MASQSEDDKRRFTQNADEFKRLIQECYERLRELSRQRISKESIPQSWTGTELVSELYLRLSDKKVPADINDFVPYAVTVMRNLLVDRARGKKTVRRNGGFRRQLLEGSAFEWTDNQWLDIDELLTELAKDHPRRSQHLMMRKFGYKNSEIAQLQCISEPSATADYNLAIAWVAKRLQH